MQNLGSHPDIPSQNLHFNSIPAILIYLRDADSQPIDSPRQLFTPPHDDLIASHGLISPGGHNVCVNCSVMCDSL